MFATIIRYAIYAYCSGLLLFIFLQGPSAVTKELLFSPLMVIDIIVAYVKFWVQHPDHVTIGLGTKILLALALPFLIALGFNKGLEYLHRTSEEKAQEKKADKLLKNLLDKQEKRRRMIQESKSPPPERHQKR